MVSSSAGTKFLVFFIVSRVMGVKNTFSESLSLEKSKLNETTKQQAQIFKNGKIYY